MQNVWRDLDNFWKDLRRVWGVLGRVWGDLGMFWGFQGMDPSRGKGGLLSGPLGEGGQGMRPHPPLPRPHAPLSRPLGGKALEDLPPFWKGCGRSATLLEGLPTDPFTSATLLEGLPTDLPPGEGVCWKR